MFPKKINLYVPPGEDKDTLGWAYFYLQRGLIEKLEPNIAAASHTRTSISFIEVGIAVGGGALKQGVHAFQISQRLPLLYEEGADVDTKEILEKIDWKEYKIDPKRERVGIFVNIQTKGDVRNADMIRRHLEREILHVCDYVKEMKRMPRKELEAMKQATRSFDPKKFKFPDPSTPIFYPPGSSKGYTSEGVMEIAKAYKAAHEMGLKIDGLPTEKVVAMLDPYKSSPTQRSEVEALRCSFADKVTTEFENSEDCY